MTIERLLRALAGFITIISILIAVFHSPWWLLLTAFVALNLLQSAFSNWCPAMTILEKLGFRKCMPSA
ncbi:MAG TPA: DUF2892 domain-containing protein [Acidobacteriota bacterium]|nr:DUF2892 domain-containing protein [Acidobacteriota bacterium]